MHLNHRSSPKRSGEDPGHGRQAHANGFRCSVRGSATEKASSDVGLFIRPGVAVWGWQSAVGM